MGQAVLPADQPKSLPDILPCLSIYVSPFFGSFEWVTIIFAQDSLSRGTPNLRTVPVFEHYVLTALRSGVRTFQQLSKVVLERSVLTVF